MTEERELSQMRMTERRKELLQLVYENPNHTGVQWYADQMGYTPNAIYQTDKRFPDLFETEAVDDQAGSMRWRLSEKAIDYFKDEGVLDDDAFADFEHEAEEPSQTTERGNVKITGGLDTTDSWGEQTWGNRPVKQDEEDTAEVGEPESDPCTNGKADEEGDPDGDGNHLVELTGEDVFDIVRNASEETARRVFDETRGNVATGDETD